MMVGETTPGAVAGEVGEPFRLQLEYSWNMLEPGVEWLMF